MDIDQAFDQAMRILRHAIGPDRAVTIADLSERLSISRRECEALLEERLASFPFVLAAGATGYYRPNEPEQINQYVLSLRKRHAALAERERTVIHKACAEGWINQAGRFTSRPTQLSLF